MKKERRKRGGGGGGGGGRKTNWLGNCVADWLGRVIVLLTGLVE